MNPPPAEGFASRFVLGPALRTQPDRRLVTLVREGYEAAFDEIVRRYGKPLGRYAGAIVGGRAEDVTQDAFSKALLALRRDDSEIELRPWLYRIVRNTALNDLRDRPADAEELAETIAGGRNPAEELEQREELADLIKRLGELPESQRAAIVMRELEGLSHEEIAAALGLSGGAARQAIHRARTALRNGAGILLPLPLLRLLIDHGAEATAAGVGTTAAAAGGAAGGAGATTALKAGVVTAVLAGSVGTGIAIQETRDGEAAGASARVSRAAQPTSSQAPPSGGALASIEATRSGEDGRRGEGSGSKETVERNRATKVDRSRRHGGRPDRRPHRRPPHRRHGGRRGDGLGGPGGRHGPGPAPHLDVGGVRDGSPHTRDGRRGQREGSDAVIEPPPYEPPPPDDSTPDSTGDTDLRDRYGGYDNSYDGYRDG